MFSIQYSTPGQAPANQLFVSTFFATTKHFNPSKRRFNSTQGIFLKGMALLIGLFFLTSCAFGQESGNLQLSSLPHSLTLVTEGSTQLDYELSVGTAVEPVNNAYGYLLTGTIENLNATPSKLEVNLDNSWMGSELDGSLEVEFDHNSGEFSISFTRTNNSTISDHGLMAEISLVADPGKTLPENARLTLSGGSLIMVDNTGFKRGLDLKLTYQKLTAYPNPSQGQVHFQAPGFEGEWALANAAGRIILKGNGGLPESIDLSGQPKGIYILTAQDGTQLYRSTLVRN